MKPMVGAGFWRGVRYALLPSLLLWAAIIFLAACAPQRLPEVTADEAAGKTAPPKERWQIILAAFELVPGAGFFILPVEYSLTGTTGLEQAWVAVCDAIGGDWSSEGRGSCTEIDWRPPRPKA